MKLRRFLSIITIPIACCAATYAEPSDSISYIPHIHGTFRGRFEASTVESDYRFQVRNARIKLDGKIAPIADYFIQVDFCDRGSIKILDAWARIWASKSIGFQAGQFRMPFGVDPFRGPNNYIFSNRSFIGKYVCNFRAVGFKAIWQSENIPLNIEAGAFNPATISDHSTWHNKLTYATKLTYRIDNVSLATGFQSIAPDHVRANLVDGAVSWKNDRWTIEGEYMYKHYTRSRHKSCHAYNMFADYRMPIKTGFFNQLSFQTRFDGMTGHSSAKQKEEGLIVTDNPACNRFTAGSTISYKRNKSMSIDLRANYEKYIYHSGERMTPDNGDKAVIELVLNF